MTLPTSSPLSDSALPMAPSPLTREMDRLTGIFTNRLEDHPSDFRRKRIAASRAPAADELARLEDRRDELHASLIATPGPALHRTLTLLLAGSREYGSLHPKDAALRLGLYIEALRGIPAWAVERARLIFGKGGWRCLWDGRDVPASHDVVAECRFLLLPVETELRRIEAVLGAELYDTGATDDDRANAVAHWETVKAEIRGEGEITERTEVEISAERTTMARANQRFRERARLQAEAQGRGQAMWGRLPISDELARQIGLRVPVPDHEEEEVH